MYPAAFEYHAPSAVEEAISLLEEHGEEAKLIAGGQSLIPLMKIRFATPGVLVDLNRIPGLDTMRAENGGLKIGALVRHKTCERSELARGRFAIIGDAARVISDPIVRNRGTVVGSLAHADPQGDWGAVMLALRAEIVAQGSEASRVIPIDDFFAGAFTTTLGQSEVVTEVRVSDPGSRSGGTYLKLERKVGDYATAAVAVQVALADGRVEQAGIALTGVGPGNIRAIEAEASLRGSELTDAAIAEAGRLTAGAASPHDDVRGSAEYKRNVVRVFTERGLREAAKRARAA